MSRKKGSKKQPKDVVEEYADTAEFVEETESEVEIQPETNESEEMLMKLRIVSDLIGNYLDVITLKSIGFQMSQLTSFFPMLMEKRDERFPLGVQECFDKVDNIGALTIKESHKPGVTIPRVKRSNYEIACLQSECRNAIDFYERNL